jgi:hypothetical protein
VMSRVLAQHLELTNGRRLHASRSRRWWWRFFFPIEIDIATVAWKTPNSWTQISGPSEDVYQLF